MANLIDIKVNDREFRVELQNFSERISRNSLLKAAGEVMRGSIVTTFREQGSPAGSWAPLKAWTRTGAQNRLKRGGKPGGSKAGLRKNSPLMPGKQILIQSGRLRNSPTYKVEGDRLVIGTDVVYARIHQEGGRAGRNHAARIPARPYLVFRPEDPDRIVAAMETVIDRAKGGLR